MFSFRVEKKDDGKRVDLVIAEKLDLSRSKARRIVESGAVFLNSSRINFPSRKIFKNDFVEVLEIEDVKQQNKDIETIFKDDLIIVVNKPPFLISSSEKNCETSVLSLLKKKYPEISEKIFAVHRLDKETSGSMIFAIGENSKKHLEREFKERRVMKKYIALVEGKIKEEEGVLSGKLKITGEYAMSKFSVLKRFRDYTLVEVMPKTGRTHQIRIQFYEYGHPVVGDKKYFSRKRKPLLIPPRHLLHSKEITFRHPASDKIVTFVAKLPDDFVNFITHIRQNYN